jgi:hypothetical protein
MNDSTLSSTPTDHLRYEFSQLEKMRQQILSDMDALRVQEHNLRSYEAKVRGSRSPMPTAPVAADSALDAERDKVARLRALLEAERRAVVDERLVLREEKELLAQKAEELKQREAWIEVRERDLQARSFAPPAVKTASASPFAAARNLFSFGSKRAAG